MNQPVIEVKDYKAMVQAIVNVTVEGLAKGYHGKDATPQKGLELFQHLVMDMTDWIMARLRGPKSVAHCVVAMGSGIGLQHYVAEKSGMPIQPNAAKEAGRLFAAAMQMSLDAARESDKQSPIVQA